MTFQIALRACDTWNNWNKMTWQKPRRPYFLDEENNRERERRRNWSKETLSESESLMIIRKRKWASILTIFFYFPFRLPSPLSILLFLLVCKTKMFVLLWLGVCQFDDCNFRQQNTEWSKIYSSYKLTSHWITDEN